MRLWLRLDKKTADGDGEGEGGAGLECTADFGADSSAWTVQNYDMNMNEVHIMMLYNTPS